MKFGLFPWLERGFVNITFEYIYDQEWQFDVEEIRRLIDE
jgi:hypothetical protein